MPQKAKGENTFQGRYERTQPKVTARVGTTDGPRAQGKPTKGSEAVMQYSKSKLRD